MGIILTNWKSVGCPTVGAFQYMRAAGQDFVLGIPSNIQRLFVVDYNSDGTLNFSEIPAPDANFAASTFANPVGVDTLLLGTRATDAGYAALNGFQVNGRALSPVALELVSASPISFASSTSLLVASDDYLFIFPLVSAARDPTLRLSGGVVVPIRDIRSAVQAGHYRSSAARPLAFGGLPVGQDIGPLPPSDLTTVVKTSSGTLIHYQGRLYFWGGTTLTWNGVTNATTLDDVRVWSADIRTFKPGDTLTWVETGVIPAAVHRSRGTIWRDWLLSVGGYSTIAAGAAPATSAIWAARIGDTQTFTQIGDAPTTINRGAVWVRGNKLYIVGGHNGAGNTNITDGWMATLEETR